MKLTDTVSAVGRPQHSTLNSEDAHVLQQLLENCNMDAVPTGSSVTLYPKMMIRSQVIFSKCATRVKKRNTYTVTYSDPQMPHQIAYGRVESFLCPVDSLHLAIIKPINVQNSEILENLEYPPEIQCLAPLLSTDFVSVTDEAQKSIAIPVEHIWTKCFDISTVGFSGLTTLVNENEVLK